MGKELIEPAVFWVLFDAEADQKYIKKSEADGSLAFFDAEHEAARAKRVHPGTDFKRVEYYTAPPPPQWISVEERLPESGEHVLAYYTNSFNKGRRIRAEYVAAMIREVDWDMADPDTQCVEHDEQSDCFYLTAGWYELMDNWDEYSSIAVVEGVVSHWMPLPKGPE